MTDHNLAFVRAWITWYAEQPISPEEFNRACSTCGSLHAGDLQRRLERMITAAARAKGEADAAHVHARASCRDDQGYTYGCMDNAAETLEEHAADVPLPPVSP